MKINRYRLTIMTLLAATGFLWHGVTNATTLRLEFQATVTDIRDRDAPFDTIAIGDVIQGYFDYVTDAYDFIITDNRNTAGPTTYIAGLQVFQKPPSFVTASVTIGDHVFNPYALGGGQQIALWDEPPTTAGFDQFTISHISQATAFSATTELLAVVGAIQLIDALVDEELVQQFEWSAALEPDRAFVRTFGLEYIQPNALSASGRSRLDIVGDINYARLTAVPLPPALTLFGSAIGFTLVAFRKHKKT
jgi:hypothetical protein